MEMIYIEKARFILQISSLGYKPYKKRVNHIFVNTQQAPLPLQSSFEEPAKLASKISQLIKGEIALIIMNNIRRVKKALKLLELMFLFNLSKNPIPLNSILIRYRPI